MAADADLPHAVEPPVLPQAPNVPPPSCPYCAVLLDPPPPRGRLCPRCRQRIVVRHVDGRAVYLTEAAVPVFEGERRRTDDQDRWAIERRRWLHLAKVVKAPAGRREQIERAPLSAESVHAARTLYLASVEREVRAARRAARWNDVAIRRREQAAALFEESGSPVPPPEEVLRLHQEGAAAALRAMVAIARWADLVGAGCCPACRADDGRTFRIADELRVPRLPHPGCPRGLCQCDWWISTEVPKRRRRSTTKARSSAAAPDAAPDPGTTAPTEDAAPDPGTPAPAEDEAPSPEVEGPTEDEAPGPDRPEPAEPTGPG